MIRVLAFLLIVELLVAYYPSAKRGVVTLQADLISRVAGDDLKRGPIYGEER